MGPRLLARIMWLGHGLDRDVLDTVFGKLGTWLTPLTRFWNMHWRHIDGVTA